MYNFLGFDHTCGGEAVPKPFGDGAGLAVARTTENTSSKAGAGGGVSVNVLNDKRAELTLSLARENPFNERLYAAVREQNKSETLYVFTYYVHRKTDGQEMVGCDRVWIKSEPDQEFAAESGNLDWVLETDSCRQYETGTTLPAAQALPTS